MGAVCRLRRYKQLLENRSRASYYDIMVELVVDGGTVLEWLLEKCLNSKIEL
jgi:hypothetical protein